MYIFPYNQAWVLDYKLEKESILKVYTGEIELYHIGATAIPNLYAKDCIDVLGVVEDLSKVQLNVDALLGLGYKHKGEFGIKGREYFSKLKRKTHLHIIQAGDSNISRHLFFVKIMRKSPRLVNELNVLKKRLHDQYPDRQDQYQQEKGGFYREIHTLLQQVQASDGFIVT